MKQHEENVNLAAYDVWYNLCGKMVRFYNFPLTRSDWVLISPMHVSDSFEFYVEKAIRLIQEAIKKHEG